MNTQKKAALTLVRLVNDCNSRGGLLLEQSHRLYEVLTELKDNEDEAQTKILLGELFEFVELFQRAGKLTLSESFVAYLCINAFLSAEARLGELGEYVIGSCEKFL
jgi:hypothetical protein